jgi:hypothetical protein
VWRIVKDAVDMKTHTSFLSVCFNTFSLYDLGATCLSSTSLALNYS